MMVIDQSETSHATEVNWPQDRDTLLAMVSKHLEGFDASQRGSARTSASSQFNVASWLLFEDLVAQYANDEEVLDLLLQVVARFGGPEHFMMLNRFARDERISIGQRAIQAMRCIGGEVAIKHLQELASEDLPRPIARAASWASTEVSTGGTSEMVSGSPILKSTPSSDESLVLAGQFGTFNEADFDQEFFDSNDTEARKSFEKFQSALTRAASEPAE